MPITRRIKGRFVASSPRRSYQRCHNMTPMKKSTFPNEPICSLHLNLWATVGRSGTGPARCPVIRFAWGDILRNPRKPRGSRSIPQAGGPVVSSGARKCATDGSAASPDEAGERVPWIELIAVTHGDAARRRGTRRGCHAFTPPAGKRAARDPPGQTMRARPRRLPSVHLHPGDRPLRAGVAWTDLTGHVPARTGHTKAGHARWRAPLMSAAK